MGGRGCDPETRMATCDPLRTFEATAIVPTMKWFVILAACFGLTAPSPVGAQSPVLEVRASSIALQFWTRLKANDGSERELVAENATFGMMGLGGSYDPETMSELASHCDLVGMFGGNAKAPSDPTKYVWAILECSEDGGIETLPLGLGIRDDKVTQLEVDMFPQVSIDRSLIEGK